MSNFTTDINISLEQHLLQALIPLPPLLPGELAAKLNSYISEPSSSISYDTLYAISKWSRSEQGQNALETSSLSSQDYSMIALLAGTTTSPEGKFGTYVPPRDPHDVELDRARERKAITALINGLFSVIGVGCAAWWGADKTGWRMEWRALFAFSAAILVAVAEGGLYVIWQSHRSTSKKTRLRKRIALHKKTDGDETKDTDEETEPAPLREDDTAEAVSEANPSLRHRR